LHRIAATLLFCSLIQSAIEPSSSTGMHMMLLRLAAALLISALLLVGAAEEECETSAADGQVSCKSGVSSSIDGIDSVSVPMELIELAGYYADTQSMLDILDYRFGLVLGNDDDEHQEEEVFNKQKVFPYTPLVIRGFDFGIAAGDATVTAVSAQTQASVNDVLAALGDELSQVLTAARQQYACTNASFVGWLGSSTTLSNYTNLLRLNTDATTSTLLIPLILPDEDDGTTTLQVTKADDAAVTTNTPLKTGTALIIDHSKVTSFQAMPSGQEEPHLVLAVALNKVASAPPLPTSPYPLDQDFNGDPLKPLEIQPVRWARSNAIPTSGAFRMRLPESVTSGLLRYCSELGLVEILRTFLYDTPLEMAWVNKKLTLEHAPRKQKVDWYIERPGEFNQFDMLFMVPTDEAAHTDFLKAMAEYTDFNSVLAAIGKHFGWDGAVVTHISLLALSSGDHAESHADFYDTGGKAFNMLIPMILVDGSEPELLVDGADQIRGQLKYQEHESVMVGDNAYHATKSIDYRELEGKQFRFFCGIYIADVSETNKVVATPGYYKAGYPHHDPNIALHNAGNHWNPNDATKKLPTW
jgi:hypothetical protein